MRIGNKHFLKTGKTYIMGILNVTPDSFSDGGKYSRIDLALQQTERMIDEGAHIIDIGGESTRPGFKKVGNEEELKRIIPVITEIKKRFDIPISVDTFHSEVAKEAVYAGADMVNDIWGLMYKHNKVHMAEVVRDTNCSVCIMHNSDKTYEAEKGDMETVRRNLSEIMRELKMSIDIARAYGIADDKIIIDPGVGFAKDYTMNMAVLANLSEFRKLGYPVLLGASNKSVIGLTLDLPVDKRLEGTIAASVFSVLGNCSFVRVHDVAANKKAVDMAEGILGYVLP